MTPENVARRKYSKGILLIITLLPAELGSYFTNCQLECNYPRDDTFGDIRCSRFCSIASHV